jgi:hypothetical protein
MVGLTHGIGRFLQEAVFQIGVISLVIYYAKEDPNSVCIKWKTDL